MTRAGRATLSAAWAAAAFEAGSRHATKGSEVNDRSFSRPKSVTTVTVRPRGAAPSALHQSFL
jgi:hypothetical protein